MIELFRIANEVAALEKQADAVSDGLTILHARYSPRTLEPKSKDRKRIQNMIQKPWDRGMRGSRHAAAVRRLAVQMANSIKYPDKAYRRGRAAENENYHDVATIFFQRAAELALAMD